MPTSVLLAVLAAASLLALAPALVRRYDATERLAAERALSTARVLSRHRRRRSVPGRTPVNPPRVLVVTLRPAAFPSPAPPAGPADRPAAQPAARSAGESVARSAARSAGGVSGRHRGRWRSAERQAAEARQAETRHAVGRSAVRGAGQRRAGSPGVGSRGVGSRGAAGRWAVAHRPPGAPAIYRRRRVLAALVLLNAVELAGVLVVGPGFWVGVVATMTALLMFVWRLRTMALADRRRRRRLARQAAWLAAQQAEVRRAQERRAAQRRAAQKRLAAQREAVRRAIAGLDRPDAVRDQPYSIRYGGPARDSHAAGF